MNAQLRLRLETPPALGRGDFVQAPSNAEACARVADWRAWPGHALALVGPRGVGKSHLARLWLEDAGAAGAPAVLIDGADVRLACEPGFGEALFHRINRAGRGEGPLLLVGRTPPAAWASPLPDLRSRLNALAVVELAEADDALLRRLLLKFFRERSIRPGDELLNYLVRRIERSAEAAAAVVEALDHACRSGARLGRTLARVILHDADAETAAP